MALNVAASAVTSSGGRVRETTSRSGSPTGGKAGTVTLLIVLLYTKFFDWWWEAMPKYLFFLVLALSAVLFLFVLRRLRTALQSGRPA